MVIVYLPTPTEHAEEIANTLLDKRLIACANLLPSTAIYRWKGKRERTEETLVLLKTTVERLDELKSEIEKVHPYEVPCILTLSADANEAYADWVAESTAPP